MAQNPKPKRPPPKNKKIQDDQDIAIILSHAATFGTGKAAKEFGLNRKTIQRYQSDVRTGKNPELAKLVATETERSRARSRSKINRALDAMLDRVIELAPSATLPEAILGAEKIGDLATARKVMGVVEGDSEGETAPGPQGLGRETASGESKELAIH
jgi:hypothetical protein